MIDTSTPVPGPYRPPRDTERRTRLMLCAPWRDCVDVAELNPDLEEHTDATMRLLAASWDLLELAKSLCRLPTSLQDSSTPDLITACDNADRLIRYVHGTNNGPPPRDTEASVAMDRVQGAHAAWANWESLSADAQVGRFCHEVGIPTIAGQPPWTYFPDMDTGLQYAAWRGATRDRLQAELRDAVAALPA